MKQIIVKFMISGLILLFFSAALPASDLDKEKRWAEQVEDSLLDGEVVYLKDLKDTSDEKVEKEFFSLYTKAEKPKKLAVLLMHGIGAHPDWPQLINPLRTLLPESGWSVLSIQLPILANDAKPEDYEPLVSEASTRIHVSIEYLHSQGFKEVVIVAHSMGTVMASHYLAESGERIAGYVAIGMPENNTQHLAKIDLPLLDLYGSEDLPTVLGSSKARATASAANKLFQQKSVKDADHFFEGMDDALFKIVSSWLDGVSK